jgi:hypothetical protein
MCRMEQLRHSFQACASGEDGGMQGDISFFGRTNFRGDRRLFGIRRAARRSHMYLIGKTGTGSSS